MPRTAQQTLQDPKFYGLPPAEQQKVLATLDPNYARLPLAERNKVLQMGQQKLNTGPSNTSGIPPEMQLPPQEGFWASAKEPFAAALKALVPQSWGELARRVTPGVAQYDAIKNMLVMPAIDQGKQAIGAFKQANAETPWYSFNPSPDAVIHREMGAGHALAAALPLLGPWAAQVGEKEGEQLGLGNYSGAAGTAVGNLALALAPKGIGKAGDVLRGAGAVEPDWIPPSLRPLIEKTREAQKLATQNADEYGHALRTNTEDIAKQQADARKAAKSKGVDTQRTYQQTLQDTRDANAAATRAQGKITPTKAKLDTAVQEMQAQIETAREKSRQIGNKYFNAVNAKLNPLPADMETIATGLTDSLGKIKGTEAEPTVLKAISKRIEAGDALTYEDLQGFYSELGNEISKGTLPGDIYTAYDAMHEVVGEDMQRIANSQGEPLDTRTVPKKMVDGKPTDEPAYKTSMGKQLYDSRAYWRRMKQTFGPPYNPTDAANLTLDKTAGAVMQRAEQVNRLRLLGSFDRTIPQTALHIANLQKGIEALPKEAPVRAVVQPLPQNPGPAPLPKFEGTPDELARQTTPLPAGVGKTVIDHTDIVAANKEAYAKGLQRAQHWTLYLGAVWPAIEAMRYLVRGEMPTASGTVGIASSLAARAAMDRIFTNPHVVDFFTKATTKEIAAVPPELRGDLPDAVAAAQSHGLRVSPVLVAYAASVQRNRKGYERLMPPQQPQPATAGAAQ